MNAVGNASVGLRPGIGFGGLLANPIGLEDEGSNALTLRGSLDFYNRTKLPLGLELVLLVDCLS